MDKNSIHVKSKTPATNAFKIGEESNEMSNNFEDSNIGFGNDLSESDEETSNLGITQKNTLVNLFAFFIFKFLADGPEDFIFCQIQVFPLGCRGNVYR